MAVGVLAETSNQDLVQQTERLRIQQRQQFQAIRSAAQQNLPAPLASHQEAMAELQPEATAATTASGDAIASFLDLASLDMLLFPPQTGDGTPPGHLQNRPVFPRQAQTHQMQHSDQQGPMQHSPRTCQGQMYYGL